jgi:hypothetical protein
MEALQSSDSARSAPLTEWSSQSHQVIESGEFIAIVRKLLVHEQKCHAYRQKGAQVEDRGWIGGHRPLADKEDGIYGVCSAGLR